MQCKFLVMCGTVYYDFQELPWEYMRGTGTTVVQGDGRLTGVQQRGG
jgi:hypothetical protein